MPVLGLYIQGDLAYSCAVKINDMVSLIHDENHALRVTIFVVANLSRMLMIDSVGHGH